MSRLATIGFDVEALGVIDSIAGAVPTRDTSVTRSGSGVASLKCNSGAGNVAALSALSNQSVGAGQGANQFSNSGSDYYARAYFNVTNLPGSDVPIFRYDGGATAQVEIRLRSTGALAFYNATGAAQIGSDSAAISTGTWYRLEMRAHRASATSLTDVAAQVDGVSLGSSTLSLTATSGTGLFRVGWITAPGANKVLNIDDAAVNDAAGSAQTSYPGAGNVIMLLPVSDNARGANWTGGAGGTSSLFGAVDNEPPTGATFNGTDSTQVINAASDATGNYDANLTDYTTAGISGTITLVHPQWAIGCSSATATTIAMLLVSNPQGNGGTASTQSTGAVAGAYGSGWRQPSTNAQVVYSPSVTLGTSPVIRIGKRTATTRVVGACFMGAYVEYVSSTTTNQSLTATAVAVTASIQNQANKVVTATAVAATASIQKQGNKILTATAVAATATMQRQTNKILAATAVVVTASLTALKVILKALTATAVGVTAAMSRQTNKALTATAVVSTASIVRQANKLVTATAVAVTASMVRRINKTLTGTSVAVTATLSAGSLFLRTLTATAVALTASLSTPKTIQRTLTATAVAVTGFLNAVFHAKPTSFGAGIVGFITRSERGDLMQPQDGALQNAAEGEIEP